jgi:uncharacterized protein (UPF0305 family)
MTTSLVTALGNSGEPIVRIKKKHVSKACTNCRKMHAACELKRPCNRCVAHGLTEGCVDTPRKKRTPKKQKIEGQDTKSAPQSSVAEKKEINPVEITTASTTSDAWMDTYKDLFDTKENLDSQCSPSLINYAHFLNPEPFSPSTINFPFADDSLSNNENMDQPTSCTKEYAQLAKDFAELKESHMELEKKVDCLTQELNENKQKTQQLVHLLTTALYRSRNPYVSTAVVT